MAIDFDAAALAHQVTFQQRCAGHLRQPGCHRAIVARALLATPAVEVEVDQAQPALAVGDEAAAVVAHPDVIQRHLEELDVVAAAAILRLLQLRRAAQHADRLMAGDGARQPRHGGVHRIGLRAPHARLRSKGQEHAFLRAVLVRHAPDACARACRCHATRQAGQTQGGQAAQTGGARQLGEEVTSVAHDRLQGRCGMDAMLRLPIYKNKR
ncbi:hypothetical protein G6F68_012633 [Rhizopus microsporus]|nr:hypothetical protein G6F68_012633 [Rhizopus microsporus]